MRYEFRQADSRELTETQDVIRLVLPRERAARLCENIVLALAKMPPGSEHVVVDLQGIMNTDPKLQTMTRQPDDSE